MIDNSDENVSSANVAVSVPDRPSSSLRALETSAVADKSLVFLGFGDFSLLIPAADIYTLMPVQKIQLASPDVATVLVDKCKVPVFGVNKSLQILTQLPSSHSTLVVLHHEKWIFALACVRIQKLEQPEVCFYSVPINMRSRKQPFSRFAVLDQCAAGLVSAESIWQLLVERKMSHIVALAQQPLLVQGAR